MARGRAVEKSNLIPRMWLPEIVRDQVRILVVVTTMLLQLPDVQENQNLPARPRNPQGGRPPKNTRPADIQATGNMGGQARATAAQIHLYQTKIDAPIFLKLPFLHLVKDILQAMRPEADFRMSRAGLECLMDAASTYGCEYMVRGMMAAGHARRSTLMVRELQLYSRLQVAGASQSVLVAPQVGGESIGMAPSIQTSLCVFGSPQIAFSTEGRHSGTLLSWLFHHPVRLSQLARSSAVRSHRQSTSPNFDLGQSIHIGMKACTREPTGPT